MNAECLIAEYDSLEHAQVGLQVLQMNDFASDAVSVAWRGHDEALKDLERDDPTVDESSLPEKHGRTHAVELGALIGAAVALPFSLGSVILPIMIAGPILGAVAGAAAGGLMGEISYLGIDKHAAMRYDQRIADGSVLVIVISSPARLNEVKPALITTGTISLERFSERHTASDIGA